MVCVLTWPVSLASGYAGPRRGDYPAEGSDTIPFKHTQNASVQVTALRGARIGAWARPEERRARWCALERQPRLEPGSSASAQGLYQLNCCRYLFVWLLITGWPTLWRRRSLVGPALLMHHPDSVLPADPPSVRWVGCRPDRRCPASRCRGAFCAGGQLTGGYSPARLVRLIGNKVGLLAGSRPYV